MFDRFKSSRTHHRDKRIKSIRTQIKWSESEEILAPLLWAKIKMKPATSLFWLSLVLLLGLAGSCCDQHSSEGLKRKWEVWTHPFLRKRAVELAQKRLLSILGLDSFPSPGRHVIPHNYMLELYRNLSSGNYKTLRNTNMPPTSVVGITDQGQFIYCVEIFS